MLQEKLIEIKNFRYLGKNIGIKDDQLDFGVIVSDKPCSASAVFTKNTMASPAVLAGREHVKTGKIQAVVVNSKNANTATGKQGYKDALTTCELMAKTFDINLNSVLPSSTGVIGKPLPMDKIISGFNGLNKDVGSSIKHIELFAKSIMTTDTAPKYVSYEHNGLKVLGIAKGSGMIEPNMATMLCYIVTNANYKGDLYKIIKSACDKSFNRISVDTDMSTSDTVLLMNSDEVDINENDFQTAIDAVALNLAKKIVLDGEGATKLIELKISGANSSDQALLTAKTIINSPLVKTAIYGADPNWGRFIMAIGKVTKYPVDLNDIVITFKNNKSSFSLNSQTDHNDTTILKNISDLLKLDKVYIEIKIGQGSFSDTVYGCDLTEGYVKINAYYTT